MLNVMNRKFKGLEEYIFEDRDYDITEDYYIEVINNPEDKELKELVWKALILLFMYSWREQFLDKSEIFLNRAINLTDKEDYFYNILIFLRNELFAE